MHRTPTEDQKELLEITAQQEQEMVTALTRLGNEHNINQRWIAIAKTHFEEGYMALNRAIMLGRS